MLVAECEFLEINLNQVKLIDTYMINPKFKKIKIDGIILKF